MNKIYIAFLFLLPVIFSCGEQEVAPKNQILNGGVSYDLNKAAVIDYGKVAGANEVYSLNLYLMSSDIAILGKNNVPDSLSGKGHLILFEMYGAKPNELALGKYEFDATLSRKDMSFGPARAIFNANYETKTGDEYAIVSGQVVISQKEDAYVIEFDCMDLRGKRLNGYYKGELGYFTMK